MKTTIVSTVAAGVVLAAGVHLAAQGAAPAGMRFVRWVEPKEHAFSVEVPQGWSVEGGVNWLSQIDPQSFIRLQSPDGKIQAFLGDPELLTRQVPTAAGRMQAGVREGEVFRTPTGGPAKLERYSPGAQYAKQHASWRLCRNPSWVSAEEQAEVSQAMAAAIAPEARKWNLQMRINANAGEATFTCGVAQGAVSATTIIAGEGGPIQIWSVYRVAGFLSNDPLRSMDARLVMEHLMASLVIDQNWQAALDRRAMQLTGSVISMQNAATQAALAASRQQNDTLARMNHPNTFSPSSSSHGSSSGSSSSRYSSSGNARVCDAIGRCASVSDTGDSYYMDHSGNVRPGPAGGGPPDNTGVWSRLYK
jgi:hypothetical protein